MYKLAIWHLEPLIRYIWTWKTRQIRKEATHTCHAQTSFRERRPGAGHRASTRVKFPVFSSARKSRPQGFAVGSEHPPARRTLRHYVR